MTHSTRQQTEELAEAIRYLQLMKAQPDIDPDLAAKLQAAIDTAMRLGSDGLVDQVQSTIGLTHISIRQHIAQNTDMVAAMRDDLDDWRKDQEVLADRQSRLILALQDALIKREAADAGYISAIQEGTTAVHALRSEFQQVVEGIMQIRTDLDAVTVRVDQHDVRHDAADARMRAMQQQIDALLTRAAELGVELGYRQP